jgi:hypothetical protein
VEVDPERNRLRLSPIFRGYAPDFGGRSGILATLARYLDHGEKRDFVQRRGSGARIERKDYDRRLNR